MEPDDRTVRELAKFRRKIEEYSEDIGHEVIGYFIKIPYNKTETHTGKPTAELIAQVKREFADSIRRRSAARS